MFKIGDFAKFSRVSVRMLRHYDDMGLLKPARVDAYTDYRYYTADQLPRLNRILALKDLGFSLEQIGEWLAKDVSAEEMGGMLELRRAELHNQLQDGLTRLARVQARIEQIASEETPMEFDVVVRSVEAQQVAAIPGEPGEDVTKRFEELEAYVAHHGARAEQPPLSFDLVGEDASHYVVAVQIKSDLPESERVKRMELPAVEQMACLVLQGSYEHMPLAGQALLTWIEANQFEIAGPIREVYLRFGAQQEGYRLPDAYLALSANDFVTELQIPVSRIQGADYGLLFGQSEADRGTAAGTAPASG